MLYRYVYQLGFAVISSYRANAIPEPRPSATCWTRGIRIPQDDCIDALGLACNKTHKSLTLPLASIPGFIWERSGDCIASVILPKNHSCDYALLKDIIDVCVPEASWVWQLGRGGSWNIAQGIGGGVPDVFAPIDQTAPAYAVFGVEEELNHTNKIRGGIRPISR